MNTHYTSEPMQIGKHQWRIVVEDFYMGGMTFTYEWRRDDNDWWHSQREWGSYNFNDGSYLGLPRTLSKLYARETPALHQFGLAEEPQQLSLLL